MAGYDLALGTSPARDQGQCTVSDGFNDTFQIISPQPRQQLRKMRAHFTAGCRKNGDGAALGWAGRDGVVIPTT